MTPETFAKVVVEAYQNSQGVFANRVNAEELVPSSATDLEKACYLFYVIQLDYATKSQQLYAGARKLFEINRVFFSPAYLARLPEGELTKTLQEHLKPRYINEAVRRYKANSTALLEKYRGDPRAMFEEVSSAEEVLRLVKEFRGFGPKIGNFFVRTMVNSFGYDYPDIEGILPPVDVHDVRIAHLLGFIESAQMSVANIQRTKELWSEACREAEVSWLVFDKALWLLGSEGKPKSREEVIQKLRSPRGLV